MVYIPLNTDEGVEVCTIDDYIKEIDRIYQNKETPDTHLFFRGQSADFWKVEPSIFRYNMVSIEHILMSEPLRQIPNEFLNLQAPFEIMEKYQHYGLCTRLLDVTTNPLVALYFACMPHSEEEYKNLEDNSTYKQKPNGVVFYKYEKMPLSYNSLSVRIIAQLASLNLNEKTSVEKVVNELLEYGTINSEQKEKWLSDEGLYDFIDRCQKVYTVLPIMNNERLIRQSGAFLLPSKFNFYWRDDVLRNCLMSKSICSIRDEFENPFLYVSAENKETILKELENCNINKASLFPELEHQLKYICDVNSINATAVSSFETFQMPTPDESEQLDDNNAYNIAFDTTKASKAVGKILNDEQEIHNIINAVKKEQGVDWMVRDRILSRMKMSIRKELLTWTESIDTVDIVTEKIMDAIIEEHKKG